VGLRLELPLGGITQREGVQPECCLLVGRQVLDVIDESLDLTERLTSSQQLGDGAPIGSQSRQGPPLSRDDDPCFKAFSNFRVVGLANLSAKCGISRASGRGRYARVRAMRPAPNRALGR
jgi:hypothetical protein